MGAIPAGPEAQAPEEAIGPVGAASPAAENRVQTAENQNKAVAPQTAGDSGSCNEVSAARSAPDLVPEVSPDDPLAALMEKYLKEIDRMQLHDPIE